ncbi:LLM class flavin-dependent oxidoreductase [Salipaludibacillus sp. HK11]|uniref:LLM class flavin-dependent oxidoreductase n=1 Tax=Salipaludibacillus sp. HK11 TaxID=3394320 RepID=UPI0039FDBA55
MKLSILDLSPISSDKTSQDALEESLKLAQLAEKLRYTRFWMTEHHDLSGLASSSPEVILSYIGAQTKTIRLGTGAVLLPFYQPYKVAEVHHTLASLLPGRVDLGIGRAPGGSAEATNALSDHFLQQVFKMPELVKELLQFIDRKNPVLSATPVPEVPPTPWLLGTSKKSALLAAENGLAYAFGQFMSDNNGVEIIQQYLDEFKPRSSEGVPQVIVTVSAICADTDEKAEEIAVSSLIWSLKKEVGVDIDDMSSIEQAKNYEFNESEKEKIETMKRKMVIGGPETVKHQLSEMKKKYQADEIMIMTSALSSEDRMRSYQLIGQKML